MRLRQGHVLPHGPWPMRGVVLETRSSVPTPSGLPNLPAARPPPSLPSGSGSHSSEAAPSLTPSCSFTLSLRDEAAHVPVTLRASFADRTLAWISPWGCKKLISAPFVFYPRRFFEVSQSQVASSLLGGRKLPSQKGWGETGVHPGVTGASFSLAEKTSVPRHSTLHSPNTDAVNQGCPWHWCYLKKKNTQKNPLMTPKCSWG